MSNLEPFETSSSPYTSEMREWLKGKVIGFTEYDVEADIQERAITLAWAQAPEAVTLLIQNAE
jgi:hypothetical protein